MAFSGVKEIAPVVLVCGDDELGVKQRAKALYHQWCAEIGGMDHEILDASVANSSEALKVLARLREALQTLPFFGTGKAVWLKNCSFLGEDKVSLAAAVTENLAALAKDLKEFSWQGVRLLVSAVKVDKRKVFYKALEKLGKVESFAGWSADGKDWADQAEQRAVEGLRARGKDIAEEALAELVTRVGPNPRQLDNEVEKVSLYTGTRREVEMVDILAVCSRNKTARAFALGDALGDRDLPRLLRRLDEEMWEVRLDSQRSEIGLLYGLITKVRAMILLKEMLREGWVKAEPLYPRFKAQLDRVPAGQLPRDKRFNPLAINAYVLFKALPQVRLYSEAELIRAMELLLQCNQRLVSSNLDETLVLQQTLVEIVGCKPAGVAKGRVEAQTGSRLFGGSR
jgi:DNA polymerase-3 subunit delta